MQISSNCGLASQVLIEIKAPKLNSDDLYELFVQQLEIVSKDSHFDSGDVVNNLRQFSYQGNLHPDINQQLADLKRLAQSESSLEQATAQFSLGDHLFEVK